MIVSAIAAFIVINYFTVAIVSQGGDRKFLFLLVSMAWVCLFPIVVLLNEAFPFSGSGDDEDYFYAAATSMNSITDVFDFGRFSSSHEQPGFPWLLSVVNNLFGHDIIIFKSLNLMIIVSVSITWFCIGALLESKKFGRATAVCILILTPLWYYIFFLLKDISIVFLQSLFLLGLVATLRRYQIWSWLLIGSATVALIPFRSPTVLINVAVLVGAMTLRIVGGRVSSGRILQIASAFAVAGGFLVVAGNANMLAAFGVTSESRVVGSDEMFEAAALIGQSSSLNRAFFPIIYILSETSGLNPAMWTEFTPTLMRGALVIPWIFFVVPYFFVGLFWLGTPVEQVRHSQGFVGLLLNTRLIATPWGALVVFIVAYVAVSWQVGDTTRWRLPDMPVIAVVALAGWHSLTAPRRRDSLVLLLLAAVIIISARMLLWG